jgi:flavin-dependent dehydrogenase
MEISISLEFSLMEKIIIVGGGIAGLTCLNLLLDKGISPMLLEGHVIGTPKICGEFLAPAAVTILNRWNIGPIQPVEQISFFAHRKNLTLKFPIAAGAFSRETAELELARRAHHYGAKIRENTAILSVLPNSDFTCYTVELASGEKIQTQSLLICTGKFNQTTTPPSFPYYAIKAHFPHVYLPKALFMQSVNQAYFGIVPVSENQSNFACLAKRNVIEKAGSAKDFFYQLVEKNNILQRVLINTKLTEINLLEGKAPGFHLKKNPYWPNVFRVGDAFASFPPALGYGFAHSIESATMAVEYYLQKDAWQYHTDLKKICKHKLLLGNFLHQLLLNPIYSSSLLPIFKTFSRLPKMLLKQAGY